MLQGKLLIHSFGVFIARGWEKVCGPINLSGGKKTCLSGSTTWSTPPASYSSLAEGELSEAQLNYSSGPGSSRCLMPCILASRLCATRFISFHRLVNWCEFWLTRSGWHYHRMGAPWALALASWAQAVPCMSARSSLNLVYYILNPPAESIRTNAKRI